MERKDAIQVAQEIIVAVLKGEETPDSVAAQYADDEDIYHALYEMKSRADEHKRDTEYAKRELDRSLLYVNGEPGSWNSLGILQSTATRIEQHAAVFPILVDNAKRALVRASMLYRVARLSADGRAITCERKDAIGRAEA